MTSLLVIDLHELLLIADLLCLNCYDEDNLWIIIGLLQQNESESASETESWSERKELKNYFNWESNRERMRNI